MLKETSCIAPFINLTIDPENNTSPCPYLGGGAWKFDKEKDPKQIWKSSQFEKLRQSHLKGEKDPICQRCWNEEAVGKMSARQRFLKDYQNQIDQIIQNIQNKTYMSGPTILTMKNGNICNLRCRTCGPKDSSVWIPEAQSYVNKHPKKLEGTWFQSETFKKNWNNKQMEDLQTFNQNLIKVEHFGGEPLYNPRVFEHVKMLIEFGFAKNIILYFNTNGTQIPKKEIAEMFKHFKQIEINFSIDGIKNHYEYIRHPAKWSNLLSTIEWVKNFEQNNNLIWGIVTTVSNLNIFYLDKILEEFDQWNKTNVFLNILENPAYYCIKNLPESIKEKITKKYAGSTRLSSVVNFMNSAPQDINAWKNFLFWTKQKDAYRSEDFHFTFPEFSNII